MALISIKDVKEAIKIMMSILEKLDEIYHALHDNANEFRCKDGSGEILVCKELIDILEEVRKHFNAPVNVRSHSGYRTPEWNKKVNGAKNSYHCKGMAADFHVKGLS